MRLSVQVQALFYGIDYHNYCNTFASPDSVGCVGCAGNHPASQAPPLSPCPPAASLHPLGPYSPRIFRTGLLSFSDLHFFQLFLSIFMCAWLETKMKTDTGSATLRETERALRRPTRVKSWKPSLGIEAKTPREGHGTAPIVRPSTTKLRNFSECRIIRGGEARKEIGHIDDLCASEVFLLLLKQLPGEVSRSQRPSPELGGNQLASVRKMLRGPGIGKKRENKYDDVDDAED